MLHRFQDIRVEFKYPFRAIPLCYNLSFGGVASPRKSYQITGFKFLGKGVYMCVGGGELCVCVCVCVCVCETPDSTIHCMGMGVCGLPVFFSALASFLAEIPVCRILCLVDLFISVY